jgi:fengycin family lipopeptide synthetase D
MKNNNRSRFAALRKLSEAPLVNSFPLDYGHMEPGVESAGEAVFAGLDFKLPGHFPPGLSRWAEESGQPLYRLMLAGVLALLDKYNYSTDGSSVIMVGVLETDLKAAIHRIHPQSTFNRILEEVKVADGEATAFEGGGLPSPALVVAAASGLAGQTLEPVCRANGASMGIFIDDLAGSSAPGGRVTYHTGVFRESTVKRIISHYTRLLEMMFIAANRELPVSLLEVLSEREKERLLIELNDTGTDYPGGKTIHRLFEEQVEKTPDRVALVVREETLTYRELDGRANRAADYLVIGKRIKREEPVGILMEKSVDLLVALLGVLKAGGAYVPIDPSLPGERIRLMIRDTAMGVVLSRKRHVGLLNRLQWECPDFHTFLCMDSMDVHEEEEVEKNEFMNADLWVHVGETAVDDITGGGWLSSYTGKPLSRAEMDEYSDNVFEKVQPLLHKEMRVLEIGVASGITMFRAAPEVGLYYGTDLSPVIIRKNLERIGGSGDSNIELAVLAAHEIDRVEERDFDLIIVNSVIQCFHGHNYLRKVLRNAAALLKSSGWFFLGDIMDGDRKEALAQDLIAFKESQRDSCEDCTTKTDVSSELFISRGFWHDLRREMPWIADARCSDKIHTIKNELTEFRYDVLMRIDKSAPAGSVGGEEFKRLKYQDDLKTLEGFGGSGAGAVGHRVEPDHAAYIIYTSGSTGRPKGVVVPHRGIASLTSVFEGQLGIAECDRVLQFAAFSFDASVWEVSMALLGGRTLCMVDSVTAGDTGNFADFLDRHAVTVATLPPSYLKLLEAYTLRSLRLLVTAGSEAGRDLVEAWRNRLQYVNAYGPTETTICATLWKAPAEGEPLKAVPIGPPINNINIHILDRHLNLQPVGVPGELCVTGFPVARGYLNRPNLTSEKFPINKKFLGVQNPFYKKGFGPRRERLYRTGDLARWLPDGGIEFLGRIDFQVKVRGFRIEPGEVENRMLKYEDIREAAVLAREDEVGEAYLCGYFVSGTGRVVDIGELRTFLSRGLPQYMIPSYILQMESLPLTGSGKVDRKKLPDPRLASRDKNYTGPVTDLEKKLVSIWSRVLKLDPAVVGIDSDFFQLGGHSLKAASMSTEIHKSLHVKVPIGVVFDTPTVRVLAKYIEGAGEEHYSAIEPVELRDYYPQSSAQKRLYILHRMDKKSTGYNVQVLDIRYGKIDKERLEAVFKELIRRHESLRTSFTMVNGEAVQRVHKEVPFAIEYYESSEGRTGLSDRRRAFRGLLERRKSSHDRHDRSLDFPYLDPEVHAQLQKIDVPVYELVRLFVRPFDLGQAPLIRVGLIMVRKSRYVLMVDMHHIISDGVSIGIFLREYRALMAGEKLSRSRLQYKDFTYWAVSGPGNGAIRGQEEFWLKEFAGEIPLLQLPGDYLEPDAEIDTNTLYFDMSKAQTQGLNTLARSNGATLFMTLLAAFNVLLSKLSGQEDIVVGTVSAGRGHADIKQMVGVFVNTLALRNYPVAEKTFGEFLREVRERSLTAFENQDYAFEDLVAKRISSRDAERHPFFDVAFVLQNQAEKSGYLQEVMVPGRSKPYRFELNKAKFMLTLMGVETQEGMQFSLEFNRRRFAKKTAERFVAYFKTINIAVCGNPGARIADIHLLSEEEKFQLVTEFNRTDFAYPAHKSIHGLFEEQAAKTPDLVALFGPEAVSGTEDMEFLADEDETAWPDRVYLTYRELDERSGQMSRRLKAMGVVRGEVVPLVVERSIEMIIGILGILKAGGAYLPIDPNYPAERIHYMLMDSRAKVLVTPRMLSEEKTRQPDVMIVEKVASSNGESSAGLAYVIYTSGTTGWPKGVMVEHDTVVNTLLCRRASYEIDRDVTTLQLFSYAFDGFVTSFFTPVISGARVVVLSEEDIKDIIRIKEMMVKQRVTHFISVPALYGAIIEAMTEEEAAGLKVVTLAGDKISPNLLAATRKKNPALEIAHEYGVTEASVMSTLFRHQEKDPVIKIGKPVWNTALFIVDRWNNLQPLGVPGELVIGGTGVVRGYMNRPELTKERFLDHKKFLGVQNPFFKKGFGRRRLYRTGDLARWLPDGSVEFLGRIDHQVKVKGFRIEVGEIESQLLNHHGVKEAVVMAREDSNREKYLCAYYVNKMDAEAANQPELWPSVAEFFIYDELLYYAMTNDERRNDSYKVAFNKLVKDKVVVEVGTGQDAILSRFCVEAGAARVYAIEMLDESYKKARKTIDKLGLQDKITLVYGDANKIKLPEKGDVLISEIVGSIGGSEGAAVILNKAWRFLKEDGVMAPVRSLTKIAAVYLPGNIHRDPGFSAVGARYTEKVFRSFGYSFDLRLCVRNFPNSHVISNADVFEDLDFSGLVPEEDSHEMNFTINRDAVMDGFLVWLTLETIAGEVIDTLEHEYCWLPVYVPVFYPGVEVSEGDVIEASCTRTLCENGINPDFRLKGVLKRRKAPDIPFSYDLPHFERTYKGHPFYKKLFKGNDIRVAGSTTGPDAGELREYVSRRLPLHMLPSYFIHLDRMPLTPNGKIDRNAFEDPKAGAAGEDKNYKPPRDEYQGLLVDIWQQVLGVERIGIEDDFFVLGGDSIKALQVVSRLQKNGFRLDANRLFLYKTVKAVSPFLKPVEETVRRHTTEQGPVEGVVELTPIQHWFFDGRRETGGSFSQSVVIYRDTGFDDALVRKAFTHLVTHHDSLRMVYEVKGDRVKQWNRGMQGELFHMEIIPLKKAPKAERLNPEGFIGREIQRIRETLDWREEPLIKLALFKGAPGGCLAVIIHHLVVDGVSWRILLRDFESAYRQASERKGIVLSEKTSSYKRWAGQLREYAHSPRLLRHLPYWLDIDRADIPQLPRDHALVGSKRVFGDYEKVSLALDEERTRGLLTGAHRAYHTEINDLLLAAAGLAVCRWADTCTAGFHLEGHGREAVLKDIDISRTVGWFTSQYPVILELDPAHRRGGGTGWVIKTVKETLRRIPNRGMDYGILKYLTRSKRKGNTVFELKPEISFNYLGQFENGGGFRFVEGIHPEFENEYVLNIEGIAQRGRLSFSIYYNRREYDRATIERLKGLFELALKEVLAHCLSREVSEATPSDLGYPGISLEGLRALTKDITAVKGNGSAISRIYSLTPMQRLMFDRTVQNKEAYFIRNLMIIPSWAGHDLLEESFTRLIERYEPMRTRFARHYDGLEEPVQVVLENGASKMTIPVEDISAMGTVERDRYLETFLAGDKRRGFDLAAGPLMRLVRFKTGGGEDYLMWNLHHIIMDGWCLGILNKELGEIYEALAAGAPLNPAPAPPHRDYVRWQQDLETAGGLKYWRNYLREYTGHGILSGPGKGEAGLNGQYELAEHYFELDEHISGGIKRLAARRRVTLNTLFQSLWGLLLMEHTGRRDVLFGAVVSGRSPEVDRVEKMVGLFINVVPVRVKRTGKKEFGAVLEYVYRNSMKARAYEALPLELDRLLAHAGVNTGAVDHIMIFENYPDAGAAAPGEGETHRLTLRLKQNREQFHYGFCVYVAPGEFTTIRFSYNALAYHPEQVKVLAVDFENLARHAVSESFDISRPADEIKKR